MYLLAILHSSLLTTFFNSCVKIFHLKIITTHIFFKPPRETDALIYKPHTSPTLMMQNNTHFRAYLYSAGTQHGDLHQLSVTVRWVTWFILRALNTGTCISYL